MTRLPERPLPNDPDRNDLNRNDLNRNDLNRSNPNRDDFDRSDEVSLRDLFLVLWRGLPLILGLALLAGGVAYLLNAQREPVFAAESTVLVTPPPIEIEGDENLSFSPINEVSFQTYETLARSQMVLQNAVSGLPDVNISPNQLLSLGTLRQLIGPRNAEEVAPLSVIHRVRNADPKRAALLADAWAQSTLEAVRESLFASLSPVDEATGRAVAGLQENVEAVETRVQAFAARDNGTLLEAELEGLTRQLTDGRERQGELIREIAATRARIRALQDQLGGVQNEGTGGSAALSPAFLDVLSAQRALAGTEAGMRTRPGFTPSAQLGRTFGAALAESDTLSELLAGNEGEFVDLTRSLYTEAVRTLEDALAAEQRRGQRAAARQAQGTLELALLGFANAQFANAQVQTPPQEDGSPQSALTLLSAAELRREQVALQGMLAEQAILSGELASYTESAAAIQQRLATLEQRRGRLERELENALASYTTVAELQSSVSYLTELAPTNARILSQASVPTNPVGPRRAFNTGLAAVLGGLAGIVLIFLGAAIRQPAPASRKVSA